MTFKYSLCYAIGPQAWEEVQWGPVDVDSPAGADSLTLAALAAHRVVCAHRGACVPNGWRLRREVAAGDIVLIEVAGGEVIFEVEAARSENLEFVLHAHEPSMGAHVLSCIRRNPRLQEQALSQVA